MYGIVVTDEELKRLEKRFGPDVRKMGPWNSDGVFGYSDVPILAIEKAAETLGDKNLDLALFRLESAAEPTKGFIEMLETFGPSLIEKIVTAYRQCSLEFVTGTRHGPQPPGRETGATIQ